MCIWVYCWIRVQLIVLWRRNLQSGWGWKSQRFDGKVALAERELKSIVMGKARADMVLGNEKFLCKNVEFTLLNGLVKEVIIGLTPLKQYQSITLDFEGKHRPLNFKHENESNLPVMCRNVKFPALFPGIKKTHKLSKCLQKYFKEENIIAKEIKWLQENDIIEKNISPWRLQCVAVKQKENIWILCND